MGTLRQIRNIAALLLMFGAQALAYSPDRFIDGGRLANYLTPWVLTHTERKIRTRDSFISTVRHQLKNGMPFEAMNGPDPKALQKWILSRPESSISPDQLYRKAFEIKGGEIQKGMMLVWDVLRMDWPTNLMRNEFPHSTKLIDITGELDRFDGNFHIRQEFTSSGNPKLDQNGEKVMSGIISKRGDNLSAWYHFAGTALNSYIRTNSKLSILPGEFDTGIMIWLEKTRFSKSSGIDNKKRIQIDLAGSRFGAQLAKNLRKFNTLEKFKKSSLAKNTHYIYNRPDLYGADWALQKNQHPRDYGTPARTLGMENEPMSPSDLKAYLRAAFSNAGGPDMRASTHSLGVDPIYLFKTKKGDHLIRSLQSYLASGPTDPELNQLVARLYRPRGRESYKAFSATDWHHTFYDLTPEEKEKVRQGVDTLNALTQEISTPGPQNCKQSFQLLDR